jgi:hypothetical protein
MKKKFNKLNYEYGKSSVCLMIWGKVAKAYGIIRSMDNNVPLAYVGTFAHELVNLEDIKKTKPNFFKHISSSICKQTTLLRKIPPT